MKLKTKILNRPLDPLGAIIGVTLIIAWFIALFFYLNWDFSYLSISTYLGVYIMTHLYTGLFITSHDAMHGTVSKRQNLNAWLGRVTAVLFAFNSYDRLIIKHHQHHRHVATDHDPDYHESGLFWLWYWNFLKSYITVKQLVLLTVSMQLMLIFFPLENLLLFWTIPSILSTFQLFYFGTYIPHKNVDNNRNEHRSGTLKSNHLWAFLSCYFFGYHFEHHDAPGIPWWRLWQAKKANIYTAPSGSTQESTAI